MDSLVKIDKKSLSASIGRTLAVNKADNDIKLTSYTTRRGYKVENIRSIFEDVNVGDNVQLLVEPDEYNPYRIIVKDMNYCTMGEITEPEMEVIANLISGGKKLYGKVIKKIGSEEKTDFSEMKLFESFTFDDYRFEIDIFMED